MQMKVLDFIGSVFIALLACPDSFCQEAVQIQAGKTTRVSAYCPCEKCCGRWANGITASGHRIRKGDRFIAAPKEIPFGTEFIVPGYNKNKPVSVLDRGGDIKGKRIDVFFDTHQEALEWGIKYLVIKRQKE